MTIYLPELEQEHDASFPDIESALHDPDGLLAMGGDLTPNAYYSLTHMEFFLGIAMTILFYGGAQV